LKHTLLGGYDMIGTTAALILGGTALASAGVSAYGASKASGAASDAAATQASASLSAAEIEAASQERALDYLKEREAVPQELREGALKGLGGAYGVQGGEGNQQQYIDQALSSPLYGALMGGKEAGEDAILRSASATGGLRSGNVQSNLYDYNVQLENQALLQSYNQQMAGLSGLAQLPSNANAIAAQQSSIGQTLGQGQLAAGTAYSQGQVASGQAWQAGMQGIGNNLMGTANLGINAYSAGMFSDRRLKENIKKIGEYKGFNIYSWDWNIVAQKMGMLGSTIGCMADEVYTQAKEAVSIKNLFMFIDYSKIGILL